MVNRLHSLYLFLKPGAVFYLLAAFFLLFYIIETHIFDLKADTVIDYFKSAHTANAILLFAVAAFLETIFVLGYYFPGSLVLFAGVLLFSESAYLIPFSLTVWAGILSGCLFNYIMGRFFSKFVNKLGHKDIIEKTTSIINRFKIIAFCALSAHPNYCGTGFLVLGLLRLRIQTYFIITAIVIPVWIAFWLYVYSSVQSLPISANNHSYYVIGFLLMLGLICSIWKSMHNTQKDRSQ